LKAAFLLFQLKATMAAMAQLQMVDFMAPNSAINPAAADDDDANDPDPGPGPSKKRKIKTEDGQPQVKPDPDEKKFSTGESNMISTSILGFPSFFYLLVH